MHEKRQNFSQDTLPDQDLMVNPAFDGFRSTVCKSRQVRNRKKRILHQMF